MKRTTSVTRGDVFQTMGRIAVQFAMLETQVAEGLCLLANDENPVLVACLLETSNFARNVDLLNKLAKSKGDRFSIRVERFVKSLTRLRKRRNLFVHGRWDLSPELLREGKVAVTDSFISYDSSEGGGKKRESWTKGKKQILTHEDLRLVEADILRALKLSRELLPQGFFFESKVSWVARRERAKNG